MNPPSRRIYATAVFLILLVCYGYFMPKSIDWGANSRADLVYAVGDKGILSIDDYHENTGDKALFEDHYYSDKSLGPSLVALPFYAVFKTIAALPPLENFIQNEHNTGLFPDTLDLKTPQTHPLDLYEGMALTFISFFASAVPSALLGAIVFLMAARFARKESYAFLLALVYGLATAAFPYSTVLYQHQLAAFGSFAGFFLLWRVIYEQANARWLWIVGLLFGLTAITEYPVIPAVALICLWAAYKQSNRLAFYRVVIGALPPLLIFAAYNYAIFHTPLPAGYEYSTNWQDVHQQGFMSLTAPNLATLLGLTISPFRGLFFLSPVLLLSIPGLMIMWQAQKPDRSLPLLLAALILYFLIYNASSVMWWGGSAIGPRYLTPMIPFLTLPVIFAFNRWFRRRTNTFLIAALILLSFCNVWIQTLGGQYFPPAFDENGSAITNPLFQYSLPLLAKGDIARNYGLLLGLPGLLSLIPLAAIITLIYRFAATRLRQAKPASTTP